MRYFLVFFLFVSPFAFAANLSDQNSVNGFFKILNVNPLSYDAHTGKPLPKSLHQVHRVREIRYDVNSPGKVFLYTGSEQDPLIVVHFNRRDKKNIGAVKFGELLRRKDEFVLEVSARNLRANREYHYLEVHARHLRYRFNEKSSARLSEILCSPKNPSVYEYVAAYLGNREVVPGRELCL